MEVTCLPRHNCRICQQKRTFLYIYFDLQSHEDLKVMTPAQLRNVCKLKGINPSSWDSMKLISLIEGFVVIRGAITLDRSHFAFANSGLQSV
jgi:hypothetical protein